MPSSSKKGPSVTRTLIGLTQSDPSNRSCADCWSALVDPTNVYASLCYPLYIIQGTGEATINKSMKVSVALHDFSFTHQAFAPPDVKLLNGGLVDPSITINQKLGGHGLFLCSKCAEAHRTLGENVVTKVLSVQDSSAWTQAEADFMKTSGGNSQSKQILEAYMPDLWQNRRPTASSSLEDRIQFCRAKYEALAFVMPPPGPLANEAWQSILKRSQTAKRCKSQPGLQNIHRLVPASSTRGQFNRRAAAASRITGGVIPERLIDFFCTVTSSGQLHPNELKNNDLSKVSSAEDIQLWPHIADCYPLQNAYSDMVFPEHLPTFVLPNGCCPKTTQMTPTFYTFVLTTGDGEKLYGGALLIYDEHMEMEDLRSAILASGYQGQMPQFLDDSSTVVFPPKCLVLLSHYPFFDVFRESLLQLYRISLVQAPLPIERYVGNLVSEIPLPPRGKVRVEFGFTSSKTIRIERPPPNQLPLVNFSYRPLFASLSVSNIMVVLGCLLEECKVALLSRHYSILTPVSEALLSALFPFEWQGLYIPLMPYTMLDILDAPVPFLVGLDSQYFQDTPTHRRPKHVVFVDLDRDVVHLGIDDMTNAPRKVPALPSRDAQKLRSALEPASDLCYLLPSNGIKGCIMEGHEELLLLTNDNRPKYAHMQSLTLGLEEQDSTMCREEVLSGTMKAYNEHDLLESVPAFRTVHGQLRHQEGHGSETSSTTSTGVQNKTPIKKRRAPKIFRKNRSDLLNSSMEARQQGHLLEMVDPEGFSPTVIRGAFLRFLVTTFANYSRFVRMGDQSSLFDDQRFLLDLGEDTEVTSFLGRVLSTQLFQRFLEERHENPEGSEIRFFDESILAKHNRSKITTMQQGGKFATLFLDDESQKISKTFTPPPPSNRGIPESNETFHYTSFPTLDSSLFGKVRPPNRLAGNGTQSRRRVKSTRNLKIRRAEEDIMKKATASLVKSPAASMLSATKKSIKTLEAALSATLTWEKLESPNSSRVRRSRITKGRGEARNGYKSSTPMVTQLSDRTVKTLSQADTVLLNARRMRAVLLDEVVKIQATWRMHASRSLSHISPDDKLLSQHEIGLENNDDGEKEQVSQLVCLQRHIRGAIARKKHQQKKVATILLQSRLRGHIVRRQHATERFSALCIQRCLRGRRDKLAFFLVRTLVCRVQARARGYMIRQRMSTILAGKLKLFRKEIVNLWQASHTPLSLRTKFWHTLESPATLCKIRVIESELKRLMAAVGLPHRCQAPSLGDEVIKTADSIGVDSSIYRRCQEISFSKETELGTEANGVEDSSAALSYEEAERLQIHERLDSKMFEVMAGRIYAQFEIPSTEKMKKVTLAKAIWRQHEHVEESRLTMMSLFPELDGSLLITFQAASSKSRRRFPLASKTPVFPYNKDFWESISLEGLVRKHSKEVTNAFLTEVPTMMARLRFVLLEDQVLPFDESTRSHIIKKYLYGH